MTLINPIEKLEIINEYYAGLRNALHIDSLLLNQWNLIDDELDLAEIEKKIFETPSDENLKKTMQGQYSSLLLYIFLRLPLLQADIYEKQNCLLLFEPDFAPPSYCLDDTDEMIEALSRISRLGREQIINYYTKASFQEIVLLKKAIFDLDKNSLKQLLDTKNVDLTWIQKLLGLFCFMEKTKDGIVHGNISKNEYLSIIQPSILELLDGDTYDRYQSEFLDKMFQLNSIINKDDIDADKIINTLFEQSNACLKLYWSEQEIYKEQSRTIIDDYINKPCFEEFVSKCRAEFEEEEKKRIDDSNDKYGWLPADFFNVANTPSGGENWIKGLLSEVEKGYKYKNDPREKDDARIKFAMMIEQCVREGLIHDDNDSRKRLAYLLTGRKVGISINENKVITINEDKLSVLIYIVRFLFKKNGKYNKMFSLVDGVGKNQTKVSSVAELEEQKNSPHMYTQKYLSRLAEKTEVFKSFGPFMHSLYDFCPESEAALREKNRETKLAKEIRRRLKEDHDEAKRKGKE